MTVGGHAITTEGRVNLYSLSGDLTVPACLQDLANLELNPFTSGMLPLLTAEIFVYLSHISKIAIKFRNNRKECLQTSNLD